MRENVALVVVEENKLGLIKSKKYILDIILKICMIVIIMLVCLVTALGIYIKVKRVNSGSQ